MPTTPYAGNPDEFATGGAALPDDTDDASVYDTAFEVLFDRTATLAGGYKTQLADLATLKAIDTTLIADGACRWVAGLGRYILDKTIGPTDAEDQPLVIEPTTGTGRWFALDDAAAHQYVRTFTANGSWTCPRNLALALCDLWGGGGGGGAGQGSSAPANDCAGGGGGGSGQRVFRVYAFTPTTVYPITVGAGGVGGAGGTPGGGAGGDGHQTLIGAVVAANGGAGSEGYFTVGATPLLRVGGARGGAFGTTPPVFVGVTGLTAWPINIGDGGYASNGVAGGAQGGYSDFAVAGGSGGVAGVTATNKGGSGGGGGGSGPGGVGGTGGTGGDGTAGAAGIPQKGVDGTSALANTGAGGGGGGGAGAAATLSATGGNGGTGGSGQVTIRGYALATGIP